MYKKQTWIDIEEKQPNKVCRDLPTQTQVGPKFCSALTKLDFSTQLFYTYCKYQLPSSYYHSL